MSGYPNSNVVVSHSAVTLLGSTTDLGTLRTHNALQQRQAQVANATRRLLQSETLVNMLQEAGVELPSLEDLEMGRRRGAGRSDWRSALTKNHGHPGGGGGGTDISGSGDGAPVAASEGEMLLPSICVTPNSAPGISPPRSPRKKEARGGWRQHVNRGEGSDAYEKNPVVRRLKKLRHKVLYGKVGEKAYARYKSTLRANLTWRDILRPNLAASKRGGNAQPGFSRWLDSAITEEQRRAVRDEAARVIQAAWRIFKRFRINTVMRHVRNFEIGKYDWSDDDSVPSDELPDWWDDSSTEDEEEEEEGEGKEGGKKKKAKKKSAMKKSASFMKKRSVLAAVAGAMDEETMGDAITAGKEKRKKKKKKKGAGGGDGDDGGDGEDGGEDGGEGEAEDAVGEAAAGEEGAGSGKKKKGKKGKKKGGDGGDDAGGGEEGEEGAGAGGEEGEAEGDGGGDEGKRGKGRKKSLKGKGADGGLAGEPSTGVLGSEASRVHEPPNGGDGLEPAAEDSKAKKKKSKKVIKGTDTAAAGDADNDDEGDAAAAEASAAAAEVAPPPPPPPPPP
ncbi:hypothetical protein Vretimale_8977, partial [Volvox reticuliferus]